MLGSNGAMRMGGMGANGGTGGPNGSSQLGTAISGFSTDRRPIKMRDYGMLRGGNQGNGAHQATQNF